MRRFFRVVFEASDASVDFDFVSVSSRAFAVSVEVRLEVLT